MDARIIKTKKRIKDTLLFILQNKKLHEVSISEICKRAKINRNTFYAHFATPEAVLDEIAEEYLAEEYLLLNRCSTSKEAVITACKYTKQHAQTNAVLLENHSTKTFVDRGVNYSVDSPIYIIDNNGIYFSEEIEMIHTYIVNGAVAIIKEWIYSGMKESPEEIGEKIDYITTCLIAGINRKQSK